MYRLILDWCYMHERGFPITFEEARLVIPVRTTTERTTMVHVLQRFFTLKDDGWHCFRADREIEHFQAGEPARMAAKLNRKARVDRHRKDRSQMFTILSKAGCHPHWKTGIKTLRDLCERQGLLEPGQAPETALQGRSGSLPGQRTETPGTLNHKPITDSVSGETLPYIIGSPIDIVRLVRAQGINGNWHDPRLIALINAGATRDEFESAAVQAKARKAADLWAYTLGVVSGRRKDAARMAQEGTKTGPGGPNGVELVRSIVPSLATPLKPAIPAEVIDVESKRLD